MRLASALCALTLCLAPAARAQGPDAMTRIEAMVSTVEQSTLNRALPLFVDSYWTFTPQRVPRIQTGIIVMQGGVLQQEANPAGAYATAALRANLPRLEVYTRSRCRQWTAAQKAFLRDYAQARFNALAMRYVERQAGMARALGAPLSPIPQVTLRFGGDCDRAASAGGNEILISSDIVVSALFSALYVDQQFVIVPERSLAQMQNSLIGTPGQWEERRGRRVLSRLRDTPVWNNALRGLRVMYQQESMPLEQFEQRSIYDVYARDNSRCRQSASECKGQNTLAITYLSAAKVELLFGEQVDFVLAHEMGHHALGHVAQAIGSCDNEKAYEAAADRFAVALMRPREGLFGRQALEAGMRDMQRIALDGRFASGLDLFMVQSHRLAALRDGDSCAYPTFEARLAALRAFDATAFPSQGGTP